MAAVPPPQPVHNSQDEVAEKQFSGNHDVDAMDNNANDGNDTSSNHKQEGVKQVEAITTVWSKQLLIVMFILLYVVTFVDTLLQSVQSNLVAYITSAFNQHGLLATTSIVATIIGGVCRPTIAKIIDIWGRCEGYLAMLLLIILGMIMKATCINVSMYAAAHTLYWVGHLGMQYIIDVMLADMTSLENRLIMYGINATPTIATTFAGPRIADLFYTYVNFRWAFGTFIIIIFVISIPVAAIFIFSKRKAIKSGVFPERISTRTVWESTKYYSVQFDFVGMFLITFGFALLLLPFSLAEYAPRGWRTGYVIAMIVVGVVLLVGFGIWERYFAPVAFFPYKFLKDRTILGSCLLYGAMFASIYCWDGYYQSYLQVVHDQSITISGYVLNAFFLTSSFLGPFIGLLIRYTGNYKWTAVAGIPIFVLGTVLLIHFRKPDTYVGYLVMCQVLNGAATELWLLAGQLAIFASVTHQEVAVGLALFGLFGSVGSAIGLAIAGGIWTNVLPAKLYEFLPDDSKNLTSKIYGDIKVQRSYPMGSPIRDAIIAAYADVQRKMVIAGACFIPLCVVCILVWKNINVKQLEASRGKQTKGTVW
ncbi:MFS general substrate transporter [Xylariaceae sp. FL0662B]|nr:MFS general substrate transporter [Xylariaceae sp. FL0662B]